MAKERISQASFHNMCSAAALLAVQTVQAQPPQNGQSGQSGQSSRGDILAEKKKSVADQFAVKYNSETYCWTQN
jgi:hypothetical protein